MNKTRFFFDMDGTLAHWTAASEEELLQKGFFLACKPSVKLIQAVRSLSEHYDIYVLSAYLAESQYAKDEKDTWCDKHVPFIPRDHRIFIPCGTTKAEAVPGGVSARDILIDDYSVNLHAWKAAGGTGVKFHNGINATNGTWTGEHVLYTDTAQYMYLYLDRLPLRILADGKCN